MIPIATKVTKDNKLRFNEYYQMQETFDMLYSESRNGKVFCNLMNLAFCDENILLAYRSIKANKGSNTPGTDNLTIKDLGKLPKEQLLRKVRNIVSVYQPRMVRRKEIPKPNGKTRPLGIPCIWDRLIQQCILQVLEPICEAKFSEYSYGFRPNRSCEQAIAQSCVRMQLHHLYFVIEFDIKSFFDNVNHSKLIKQIWALGIQDKKLIYVIKQMLKAQIKLENGDIESPTTGTPQGGILSPLLANIVLNELDHWIISQWEEHPVVYNYSTGSDRNGLPIKSSGYRAMSKTNLKRMHIVRYADDFRIFCNTYEEAIRIKEAVTLWLKERLKLEISEEKTRVINLKCQYSEFLGISMKLQKKGGKYVVKSHICDKALQRINSESKKALQKISHTGTQRDLFMAIQNYNSYVLGIHNYYDMATCICCDLSKIAYRNQKIIKKLGAACNKRIVTQGKNVSKVENAITSIYGKSSQLKFLCGYPIAPIGYIKNKNAMGKNRNIQRYTPEGREAIHKNLGMDMSIIRKWMQSDYIYNVELADNKISLYCAQHGKCAVTNEYFLSTEDIHCHHIIPIHQGGTDQYNNLVLLKPEIHNLIHMKDYIQIKELITRLNLKINEIKKINKYREKAGLETIPLNEKQ